MGVEKKNCLCEGTEMNKLEKLYSRVKMNIDEYQETTTEIIADPSLFMTLQI